MYHQTMRPAAMQILIPVRHPISAAGASASPGNVRAMDQFERLTAESAKSARIMAIAVHAYISGVPHRFKYRERIFDELAKNKDAVFWNGDQNLDWYKSARPSSALETE